MVPCRLLACAVVAGAALVAQAQVYKWVDEKGRTHYGEKAPEGAKATEIDKPTPPSDPSKVVTDVDWGKKAREATQERLRRESAEAERNYIEQNQRNKAVARCANARRSLDSLENARRPFRVEPNGRQVYLSEAEREPAKARARREVQDYCPD